MDKSSLIGVIIGVVCLSFVAWHGSHGHLMMFFSLEGVFTVFGGSISVVFMAMPMDRLVRVPGYVRKFMFQAGLQPVDMVKLFTELSDVSRKEGILALETRVEKLGDPFLMKGLKQAVDGVDPSAIETTMRFEILAMQERHKAGKKFFDLIKLYGPGWGLVGTLIGQIGMFGQLGSGSVEAMGHALALAVVATMYGTVLANAVAGPIGDKLAMRSSQEILAREMMLQGILSLQAGDSPRITQDKILAFLPIPTQDRLRAAA
ncbi:MAG TPA: MotA/TolQ/ExbB proton channel family protein [Phycisphaerales bacterium]|nr:MotA/TolQ/ExbB proton channel family protein [Phycisphaerales bacterium]